MIACAASVRKRALLSQRHDVNPAKKSCEKSKIFRSLRYVVTERSPLSPRNVRKQQGGRPHLPRNTRSP